jgi:hypothetical protein
MLKVCNRSKSSNFSHTIHFNSIKGYDLKLTISGTSSTQTVTMALGKQ